MFGTVHGSVVASNGGVIAAAVGVGGVGGGGVTRVRASDIDEVFLRDFQDRGRYVVPVTSAVGNVLRDMRAHGSISPTDYTTRGDVIYSIDDHWVEWARDHLRRAAAANARVPVAEVVPAMPADAADGEWREAMEKRLRALEAAVFGREV